MAARIIDHARPNDEGNLFATVAEALEVMNGMISRLLADGGSVKEQIIKPESFPRYEFTDASGNWIGTYQVV